MVRSTSNFWLNCFALFTAFATLCLICLGGLVTSHGVGMSVPDWPTTYGYNMFFFPISKWVGGIFYEHTHRLLASAVGLFTVILSVWLWCKDSRRWLCWLGVVAVFAVCLQGLLGGLRVTLYKDEIGIFHATLAQLFFILMCAIALFTSTTWQKLQVGSLASSKSLQSIYLSTTILIFIQLMLGATMRHQHAGLAIPDFPTAYGKWWPDTDAESLTIYNQHHNVVNADKPVTAFQISLQMAHRVVAGAIFILVATAAWLTQRRFPWPNCLSKISLAWLVLIFCQVLLGAATIWTGKSADIATAHVAVGALSLMTGSILTMVSLRLLAKGADEAMARSVVQNMALNQN